MNGKIVQEIVKKERKMAKAVEEITKEESKVRI